MADRHEFLFVVYDHPGVAVAKFKFVESHENMIKDEKAKNSSVEWLAGGPFFKKHGAISPEVIGSWGILYAPTRQEAVERLKRDVFTTEDIWDWAKMVVVDSVSGMRLPLPNPGTRDIGRGLQ